LGATVLGVSMSDDVGGTEVMMGDVIDDGEPAWLLLFELLLPGDIMGLSLSWIPCFISFLHFDLRF